MPVEAKVREIKVAEVLGRTSGQVGPVRVDAVTIKKVEQAINKATDGGVGDVRIDLTGVSSVDALFLRTLLLTIGKCKDVGGRVRLAGVNDRIRETIELSGLLNLLDIEKVQRKDTA